MYINNYIIVTQFLNVLFNHKRVCIDEQSVCDSDSNQFLPQFLLRYNTDNDLSILKHIHFISERLIDTDDELLTKHEDGNESSFICIYKTITITLGTGTIIILLISITFISDK